MFNPARLSFARRRRGLTRLRLASLTGLGARSVNGYETGELPCPDPKQVVLAEALRFPVVFFHGPDIDELDHAGVSFRSLKSMSASVRDAALASGALAAELARWIEHRFELPNASIPHLANIPPEEAADMLRVDWRLGQRCIPNMVHLLESRGVRVFSLPIDSLTVDAFSVWHRGTPFVFLNTKKSAEHSRFDAAHELGHLVLHQHGGPRGRDAEHEAHRFASAFLMPRGSVLASRPLPTLASLVRQKKMWLVSVAALAYRLHGLRLLTDWQYRSMCIDIAQHGFHRAEPDSIPRESSQVLAKVFASLRNEGVTRPRIAHDLGIHTADLDALLFGLVSMISVEGGAPRQSGRTEQKGERPPLRVV